VIFLDIDGPLVPGRAYKSSTDECDLNGNRPFDSMAVTMINRLIERSRAKVVISSAWSPIGKVRMQSLLKEQGLEFRFHQDWTSFNREGNRRETIERWLARHPEIKKYVAIDDNPVIAPLEGAVLVNFEDGFLLRDYRHACDILGVSDNFNIKPPPPPLNLGSGSDYRDLVDFSGPDFFSGLKKKMKEAGLEGLKINVEDDKLLDNVRQNIRRQLPQVRPHQINSAETVVVGGGWSLDETFEDLRKCVWKGANVVACNGAGNWLVERNIKPHAIVILDARPSNVKFVEQNIEGCKYFLASQCDPSLFEACKDRDTYIWHCGSGEGEEGKILDEYYVGAWNVVPGTCCVGFRAVCMLRMLGFMYFHIFGVDSCYKETGEHHAYAQPENDGEDTIRIQVAGKDFTVSAWQYSQAIDFAALVKCQGHQFFLDVHGNGLIAHMIRNSADIDQAMIDAGKEAKMIAAE